MLNELAVLHEVAKIEQQAARASQLHAAAAEWWFRILYWIGLPASILTIFAGSILLSRVTSAPIVSAVIALFASGCTLLLTILSPREKALAYKQASARFQAVSKDASVLRNVRPYLAKSETPLPNLADLVRRWNELNNDGPLLSSWAERISKDAPTLVEHAAVAPNVRSLPGVVDVYDYLANRIAVATKSVDDITWGSRKHYRSAVEQESYERYTASVRLATSRDDLVYREISTLSSEHYLKRAVALLGAYGYHLAYYDTTTCEVPLMSFMILDRQEVILGFYRSEHVSVDSEIYLAVADPLLVALMSDYFDTLWRMASVIKEGPETDNDKLKAIAARIGISDLPL